MDVNSVRQVSQERPKTNMKRFLNVIILSFILIILPVFSVAVAEDTIVTHLDTNIRQKIRFEFNKIDDQAAVSVTVSTYDYYPETVLNHVSPNKTGETTTNVFVPGLVYNKKLEIILYNGIPCAKVYILPFWPDTVSAYEDAGCFLIAYHVKLSNGNTSNYIVISIGDE